MKNLLIAVLVTYVFYFDFCMIQMPILLPFMVAFFWAVTEAVEDLALEHRAKARRARKLQNNVRRLILSKRER